MHLHLTPEMQRLCSCATMAESKGSDPRSPRAPSPGGLTRTREKGDGVGGWCETCTKSGGTWLEGDKTGTDGFRVLCHQFSASCLLRLANCISRSNSCLLTTKHMRLALLQWVTNGDQGQNIRTMVFPLNTSRSLFIVSWRTTKHFVRLQ